MQFKGDVKAGETVLVTAAAGGTGHLAAQIAKLKGCRVIATCGSQEKANKLSSIGIDRVINYRHEVPLQLCCSRPQQNVQSVQKMRRGNGSTILPMMGVYTPATFFNLGSMMSTAGTLEVGPLKQHLLLRMRWLVQRIENWSARADFESGV